jgi:hypothetical protein
VQIDLIAVGKLMLDVIVPPLRPGRAAHGRIDVRADGIPVTAALAARRTGAGTAVAGRVGDDPAAVAIEHALSRAGVELWLAVDAQLPTGTFVLRSAAVSVGCLWGGPGGGLAGFCGDTLMVFGGSCSWRSESWDSSFRGQVRG